MAREAQLQLLSRYENIELAEEGLGELCRTASVDDDTIYWIGMALREALANAIKHGNKLNPDKRVHVRIEVARRAAQADRGGRGGGSTEQLGNYRSQNLLRSSVAASSACELHGRRLLFPSDEAAPGSG
jgi:serine/threonine-protein kinase RsbW